MTPTVVSPFAEMIGSDLIDLFRISTHEIWHVGDGSINGVMFTESDAMVLARVAMGESPGSLDDQMYIMWNIRLRAELGFKGAGANGGWRAQPDRWGPPTSIKEEALCDGGCQYEAVRATNGIYFPEIVRSHIRRMISPTDEELGDFYLSYMAALTIVDAPMSDFPEPLRGYDSFRAPSIDWHGRRHRSGGLLSAQFLRGGEIWRDSYPQDNEYWDRMEEEGEVALSEAETWHYGPVDLKTRLLVADGQIEIAERLCDTQWLREARFHLGIAISMASASETPVPPTSTPVPTSTLEPTATATAVLTPTEAYATVSPAVPLSIVELHESSKEVQMLDILSPEQIIVIAVAVIIQVIKIVWVNLLKKPKPSKAVTRLLVFVVSIPVGLAIGGFGVPEVGEDPMQFAIALVTMAGEVLLYAHIFYKGILAGVLEWLDKGRALLAP